MRTKDQHEKEKLLTAEMKKLDQKIKREEKEERNLRKLIYADTNFTQPPQQFAIAGEDAKEGDIV